MNSIAAPKRNGFRPAVLGFKTPYACEDGLVDLLTSAPANQNNMRSLQQHLNY